MTTHDKPWTALRCGMATDRLVRIKTSWEVGDTGRAYVQFVEGFYTNWSQGQEIDEELMPPLTLLEQKNLFRNSFILMLVRI